MNLVYIFGKLTAANLLRYWSCTVGLRTHCVQGLLSALIAKYAAIAGVYYNGMYGLKLMGRAFFLYPVGYEYKISFDFIGCWQ